MIRIALDFMIPYIQAPSCGTRDENKTALVPTYLPARAAKFSRVVARLFNKSGPAALMARSSFGRERYHGHRWTLAMNAIFLRVARNRSAQRHLDRVAPSRQHSDPINHRANSILDPYLVAVRLRSTAGEAAGFSLGLLRGPPRRWKRSHGITGREAVRWPWTCRRRLVGLRLLTGKTN